MCICIYIYIYTYTHRSHVVVSVLYVALASAALVDAQKAATRYYIIIVYSIVHNTIVQYCTV